MPYNPYDPKANLEYDAYDDNAALQHLKMLQMQQRDANESEIRPMRGQLPRWAPGEFEEWKQGHITGLGTEYGRNAQREYQMRHIPGMIDMMRQGAKNANAVSPTNTAMAALIKGIGRR